MSPIAPRVSPRVQNPEINRFPTVGCGLDALGRTNRGRDFTGPCRARIGIQKVRPLGSSGGEGRGIETRRGEQRGAIRRARSAARRVVLPRGGVWDRRAAGGGKGEDSGGG